MNGYEALLKTVFMHGEDMGGRNGGTTEIFGTTLVHDMEEGFPVVTTKKVPIKAAIGEFIAFLRGYTREEQFAELGCNYWKQNSESEYWKANPNYEPGSLGPVYGAQWKNFPSLFRPPPRDPKKPTGSPPESRWQCR